MLQKILYLDQRQQFDLICFVITKVGLVFTGLTRSRSKIKTKTVLSLEKKNKTKIERH